MNFLAQSKSHLFLICLIFNFSFLLAEEPVIFDFFKLEALHQPQAIPPKTIQIKGFLYQNADSQWILAAQPNLKSCCVGNSSKRYQQLLISGSIAQESPSYAITLQGDLYLDPLSPFPNRLENASIVNQENPFSLLFLILGSLGIFTLIAAFVWKQKK